MAGAFQQHGIVMAETTVVICRMKTANVLDPKLATAINSHVPMVTAFGILGSVMAKTTVVTGPTNHKLAFGLYLDIANTMNSDAATELAFHKVGCAMVTTIVAIFQTKRVNYSFIAKNSSEKQKHFTAI